ncbi:MAG: hypothetical protein HY606_14235 [Planctomycetes bacterium]|nr:hypothetical protein [Planctomycetota bacterium]
MEMAMSMEKMIDNHDGMLDVYKRNASYAIHQFDMHHCIQSYTQVFNECIDGNHYSEFDF